MKRYIATKSFSLATLVLLLSTQGTYAQIAPGNGSAVAHYQNLFQANLQPTRIYSGIGANQIAPQSITGNYSATSGYVSPLPAYAPQSVGHPFGQSPTVGFDPYNAFGQQTPPLSQTLQMPRVDHSRMIDLINLSRNEKFRLVRTGVAPTMQEMDGLWYGYNTGIVTDSLGFSQFIKDLRTNSPTPTGTNITVNQVPKSQLNSGKAWQPQFDLATGDFKREGQFALLPPDGVGRYGHTVKGVYSLGGNAPFYPPNLIVSRFVKLDHEFMLAQSTVRSGNRNVHVGFFVLQRMPPTSWNQR